MTSSSSDAGSTEAAAAGAARSCSLLDLPDELLSRVFKLVYAFESDKRRRGLAVTLQRIRICQRIYAIALPCWFEHVTFPEFRRTSGPSTDAFFGGLIEHSPHWSHVQSVNLRNVTDVPALTVGTLSAFPSLESLTVTSGEVIPLRLVRAVAKIKTLRHLTLEGGCTAQHLDLRACSVRRLSTVGNAALMRDGQASHLQELEVCAKDVRDYTMPWATLEVLRLPGNAQGYALVDGQGALRSSLEVATAGGTPLPLRVFELGVDPLPAAIEGYYAGQLSRTRSEQYALLYAVLKLAGPRHLKLSRIAHCPVAESNDSFPSVDTLEMDSSLALFQGENLEGLATFLSHFPSLARLVLRGFRFHDTHTSLVADLVTMPTTKFGVRWPAFAAFLVSLTYDSRVLDFEYCPPTGARWIRFTRHVAGEAFVPLPMWNLRHPDAHFCSLR